MSFYRRGTVFLAMGRFKSALSDLSRVIELKPDFDSVSFSFPNNCSFNLIVNFDFKKRLDYNVPMYF